jgi:hypothetical protein
VDLNKASFAGAYGKTEGPTGMVSEKRWLGIVALGLTVTALVLDLLTPAIMVPAVLCVSAMAACLWLPNARHVVAAGAAVSTLTVLGFLYSKPYDVPSWILLLNRVLALIAIWVTAVLVVQYKRAQRNIQVLRGLLPICSSCKNIRGSKGEWNSVEDYLEVLSEAVFTHSLCPRCVEKWYPELYPELLERYPALYGDPQRPA